MNTPYNTGKVKIGCNYQPPKYVETDSDMLTIQSYLIYDPRVINRKYWTEKILLGISLFTLLIVILQS
jgi:hypothetical protein